MCSTKCPSQTYTHSASFSTAVTDSSSPNGESMCSQQTDSALQLLDAVYVLSRNKANGVYVFGFSANDCHYCCSSLCLARSISPKLFGSITLYTHSTGLLLALLRLQPHTIYKKICTRFCAILTTFLVHYATARILVPVQHPHWSRICFVFSHGKVNCVCCIFLVEKGNFLLASELNKYF